MASSYLETTFADATHVYVNYERCNRLSPGAIYRIFSDEGNEKEMLYMEQERYVIDNYGKRFFGFLTIRGIYLKCKPESARSDWLGCE